MFLRVLVAPDKLKGSLGAEEAARAIRRGVSSGAPGATCLLCPLADGGEGTLDALVAHGSGQLLAAEVAGPLGAPVLARLGLIEGGRTAVIECAEAIGLSRLPPEQRDPLRTSSHGVGQLILAALGAGARRLIVAVGGTATSDGGAGMAQALGARLVGAPTPVAGGDLTALQAVELAPLDARLGGVEVVAACDVDNPLLGDDGAARIYAPQKGASASQVAALEEGLANFARLLPDCDPRTPGAGAGGGLGFGLHALLGARLVPGAELVIDATGFDQLLADAQLVLTAEGRLDQQSARGKVVAAVARHAARAKVPVIAFAGSVALEAHELGAMGITRAVSLTSPELSAAESMRRAAELLESAAASTLREWTGG